MLVVLAML